jgi:hypothetical protein
MNFLTPAGSTEPGQASDSVGKSLDQSTIAITSLESFIFFANINRIKKAGARRNEEAKTKTKSRRT